MKSLKLLFVFSLLFLFSSNTAYAVIEPKLFVKDTIIGTQDDSICIKEINKTAKSALYVGTVFLAPASFLSSTFLIFKNVFSNSLALLSGTKIDSGAGNKIQHKFASLKLKRCRPYLPNY